jgi:hypothetical protein
MLMKQIKNKWNEHVLRVETQARKNACFWRNQINLYFIADNIYSYNFYWSFIAER